MFLIYFLDMYFQVFKPMPPNFDNVGWRFFFYFLSWSLVFINPFVYFFANKFFRAAYLKTFFRNSESIYYEPNNVEMNNTIDDL